MAEQTSAVSVDEVVSQTAVFLEAGQLTEAVATVQQAADQAAAAADPFAEISLRLFLAQLLRDGGQVEGALQAVERALALASTRLAPAELLQLELKRGELLAARPDRAAEAVMWLEHVQRQAAEQGIAPVAALAALYRGDVLYRLERWPEAIELAAGLFQLAHQAGVPDLGAAAALQLGEAFARNGNQAEAQDAFSASLKAIDAFFAVSTEQRIAESPIDPGEILRALLARLAWTALEQGQLEEARRYARRGREQAQPAGVAAPTFEALLKLVEALTDPEAGPEQTQAQLIEAIRLTDQDGPSHLQVTVRLLTATRSQTLREALPLLEEALSIARLLPASGAAVLRVMLAQARLLLEAGQPRSAIDALSQLDLGALPPGPAAETHRLLAVAQLHAGQLDRALKEALMSLELLVKLDQPLEQAIGYHLAGKLLRGLGQTEMAVVYLEEARRRYPAEARAAHLLLAVERSWLQLATGHPERATAELASIPDWNGLEQEPVLRREHALAWAAVSRANGSPGPALDLLRTVVTACPGSPGNELPLRLAILELAAGLGLTAEEDEQRVAELCTLLELPRFDPLRVQFITPSLHWAHPRPTT